MSVPENITQRDMLGFFSSRFWKRLVLFRVKRLEDQSNEVILIKSVTGSLGSGSFGWGMCL